ncbi:unnamed protein product [Somion occarium]|uniref:Fe2OG dioxygenase domain-containing protein n=1 Tax=Somion occarium TaxID=3059160 RepID=A0ABP1CRA9_9APHY
MTVDKLSKYLVPGTDEAYYIPEFVTTNEEDYLIRKIRESPRQRWKTLPNRRLQIWGGELTVKGLLIPQSLPPFMNIYPDVIGRIRTMGAFQSSAHGQPNHIILNEYYPGQGIMPHEDGPAYHPVVATLSLGSHAVFHYYRYREQSGLESPITGKGRSIDKVPALSLLLEPRSLVITKSSLYTSHLHGIDHVEDDVFVSTAAAEDPPSRINIANIDILSNIKYKEAVLNNGRLRRGLRYSLTCRDVERVAARLPFANVDRH